MHIAIISSRSLCAKVISISVLSPNDFSTLKNILHENLRPKNTTELDVTQLSRFYW